MKICRALAFLCALAAMPAQAGPTLGEGDVINLRIPGMVDLSGEWVVGPDAALTIPGLGTLENLSDLTDTRARLAKLIADRVGVADLSFSVAVKTWRPLVMGGAINRPGEVAYRPGMRLIEAVALAGGTGSGDFSRQVLVQQERERLLQAQARLARALARQGRLLAESADQAFAAMPPEVETLIGAAEAQALLTSEAEIARIRADTRAIAVRRIGTSLKIGDEDIVAQQAVNTSLERQLVLVRENLEKLQPLFESGAIQGARILELRRDFVDIEGRVGETRATLAKAKAGQAVLSEENEALDLGIRLELLNELVETQFQIVEATAARDTATASLAAAGGSVSTGALAQPDDCRAVILRRQGAGAPLVADIDAMTELLPGDFVQIGRTTRECPNFLTLGGPSE